jgi:hypothetical protein
LNGDTVLGFAINNSTYAYKTILNGDAFSKKFGGTTGNDTDWYKLVVHGIKNGVEVAQKDVFLADYRFSNNSQDYILKDWTWVDLSSFGKITSIKFSFESTDMGQWGINTPTYACIDSFVVKNTSNNFKPIALDNGYLSIDIQGSKLPVLENDKDPGDSLRVGLMQMIKPFNKVIGSLNSKGEIDVTIPSAVYGWDTAWYSISDVQGLSDTAQVRLLVNNAPNAKDDAFFSTSGSGADSVVFNVRENDSDERLSVAKIEVIDTSKFSVTRVIGDSAIACLDLVNRPSDTITYRIVDEFGLSDTAQLTFNITSSVTSEIEQLTELHVYPNPCQNVLKLNMSTEDMRIRMLSTDGKDYTSTVKADGNEINTTELPKGIYLLQIQSTNAIVVKRVIKE